MVSWGEFLHSTNLPNPTEGDNWTVVVFKCSRKNWTITLCNLFSELDKQKESLIPHYTIRSFDQKSNSLIVSFRILRNKEDEELIKSLIEKFMKGYSYSIDPKEGGLDSLILPDMYASTMSVFLKELSQRYPKYYILLVMDGAPCHRAGDLEVPDNIQIQEQPSYSPELNPVEHLWDEMREKWFHNETFDSMDSVEERIIQSLNVLENDQKLIQSISGFPWIMQCLVPS